MNEFKLTPHEIAEKAKKIRAKVVTLNHHSHQGHTGADLSQADILASLYFNILDIGRERLDDPDRDRYIQSKGHGVGGYYCVLAEAGFIDESELPTYLEFDSRLPGHPVRQKTPGIELNTGALGHGLPVGVGLALAARLNNRQYRVFVLTGDGELQEGSNWEAAMFASHQKLDNLIVINDRNGLQLAGKTESINALDSLEDKWRAFGFEVFHVDGHDPEAIINTVESMDLKNGRPHVIIAHTVKGKGVSFIENNVPWHHKVPDKKELDLALKELLGG